PRSVRSARDERHASLRTPKAVLSAPAATCRSSTVAECGYTTTFDCIVQNGSRRPAETTMAALYLPSTLWSEYLAGWRIVASARTASPPNYRRAIRVICAGGTEKRDQNAERKVVPLVRLELTTPSLRMMCSTN